MIYDSVTSALYYNFVGYWLSISAYGGKISVLWYFCMRLLGIPSDPKGGRTGGSQDMRKDAVFLASRDMKQLGHTIFKPFEESYVQGKDFKLAQSSQFLLRQTFKKLLFWKIFVPHFAFLTFEVGDWAKPNSTLLEPVKVDEMADCPRSYSKLIGEKRWSFCKKN